MVPAVSVLNAVLLIDIVLVIWHNFLLILTL
jgi:hypothetical protein